MVSQCNITWIVLVLVSYLTQSLAQQSQEQLESNSRAQTNLAQHLARRPVTGRANNVVLVIGNARDVVALASKRVQPGGQAPVFKRFPYVGLCTATPGSDSVCSTSFPKKKSVEISISVEHKYDCSSAQNPKKHSQSLIEKAQSTGKSTGLVTGNRVTRGSTGVAHYYAHVADQDWESDVEVRRDGEDPDTCDDTAEQLVYGQTGRQLQAILGWGRVQFRDSGARDEECLMGRREDGADLIAAWRNDKLKKRAVHAFVWDTQSLRAQNLQKTDFVLGLFEGNNNPNGVEGSKPSLAEMTEASLTILTRNPKGFMLVLEGRDSEQRISPEESRQELERAVERVLDLTNPQETLVVVTAHHAQEDQDFQASFNSSGEFSRSEGVSVFARGPWAQLLTGTFEHAYIEHAISFAACLGDGFSACTR